MKMKTELTGKVIGYTGRILCLPAFIDAILDAGGIVSTNNDKLDFLLVGKNPNIEMIKEFRKKGVKIVGKEKLREMMKPIVDTEKWEDFLDERDKRAIIEFSELVISFIENRIKVLGLPDDIFLNPLNVYRYERATISQLRLAIRSMEGQAAALAEEYHMKTLNFSFGIIWEKIRLIEGISEGDDE